VKSTSIAPKESLCENAYGRIDAKLFHRACLPATGRDEP